MKGLSKRDTLIGSSKLLDQIMDWKWQHWQKMPLIFFFPVEFNDGSSSIHPGELHRYLGGVCVCVLSFFNLRLKWWLSRRGWVPGCWGNPRHSLRAPQHPSEPLVDLRSRDYPGLSCCAKHSVDWPRACWQLATTDRSLFSSPPLFFHPHSPSFCLAPFLSSFPRQSHKWEIPGARSSPTFWHFLSVETMVTKGYQGEGERGWQGRCLFISWWLQKPIPSRY